MIYAYIEGHITSHPLYARRLRFNVAVFSRAAGPVYVRAVKLLRDKVEEEGANVELIAGEEADEISTAAGLGIFGPTGQSLHDLIMSGIDTGEIVYKHARRPLQLPMVIEPNELARGRCVAYVRRPDEHNDWTLRAEYDDPIAAADSEPETTTDNGEDDEQSVS